MKKTMKSIAQELGVSRTTVSLVLQGKGDQYRISRETQDRILETVKKENYTPNYFAQTLNAGSSRTIGIIFPDIFESFMVHMLRGIEDILSAQNYMMILMTSRFRHETEARNTEELLRRGIDGLLMAPTCGYETESPPRRHLELIDGKKLPLVMIDRITEGYTGSRVLQEDRKGGTAAAEYLIAQGCEVCTVVSLNISASSLQERIDGFTRQIPECRRLLLGRQDRNAGDLEKALADTVQAHRGKKLGFFCTTYGLSLRVKEILTGKGLVLHRDYTVIRFGGDPEGFSSGMASLIQPHYELGISSAQILLHLMDNPEAKPVWKSLALRADYGSVTGN
ncbi:LacI family DNA-binding transcriptional regulator [Marispirochaeta aestuarii]|uniref:LacI family DNA-binding transcriptional regulator n=1 Tax=Marispirochaeta aestuarii TaxID=1963862 RepID=UPI002ABD999C|nr:LacI family DNA-binding transcriptional regulator [Marispirochaeta aestuarii]